MTRGQYNRDTSPWDMTRSQEDNGEDYNDSDFEVDDLDADDSDWEEKKRKPKRKRKSVTSGKNLTNSNNNTSLLWKASQLIYLFNFPNKISKMVCFCCVEYIQTVTLFCWFNINECLETDELWCWVEQHPVWLLWLLCWETTYLAKDKMCIN